MKRALCMFRSSVAYRRELFLGALKKLGYSVQNQLEHPRPTDLLLIWNRYGFPAEMARKFERVGAKVIVCENGYLGKSWLGDTWIAMALGHHAGAGEWNVGGPERWDNLNVRPTPFRTDGKELVILGQRGFGEPGVASPPQWADRTQRKLGGRIRNHPANANVKALEDDLVDAASVATWNSGAALRALLLGVPVWYEFKHWIGAAAARHISQYGKVEPMRDEEARLGMFRSLIWAQWRLETEIASGLAFEWLLGTPSAIPVAQSLAVANV